MFDAATEAKTLIKVATPSGFNPGWLARGGGKIEAVYRINPSSYAAFELKDAGKALTHYLVKTDGYLVLCDAKGSAYVSDLDVVLVQRRLATGGFAPPGMNVGPKNTPFVGGDNPALRPFWEKVFGKVDYPPGYGPIQHGEATGTAGNYLPVKYKDVNGQKELVDWDYGTSVRTPVWNPEDTWDTEKLVVAVEADGLGSSVGWAKNWTNLVQFHNHNPMGEFRIPKL
jgi:hypothetical protein